MKKQTDLVVYSLDMDGCLFNNAYYDDGQAQGDLIKANQPLINKITSTLAIKNACPVQLIIGSARQDIVIDLSTAHYVYQQVVVEKGKKDFPVLSAVNAIQQFAEHLSLLTSVTVNRMLLADLIHRQPHGTAFEQHQHCIINTKALLSDLNDHKTSTGSVVSMLNNAFGNHLKLSYFDKTKCSILYAQVHSIMSHFALSGKKNPNVTFQFYDDHDLILSDVASLFDQRPDLLPKGLTLVLNKYVGDEPQTYRVIAGTGSVDHQYDQTVRSITQEAESAKLESTKTLFARHHTPQKHAHTTFFTSMCNISRMMGDDDRVASVCLHQ